MDEPFTRRKSPEVRSDSNLTQSRKSNPPSTSLIMKTILLSIIVLSSALGLQAGSQPSSPRLFGEIPLHQVAAKVHANGDQVTVGTSIVLVSLRLGAPGAVLPDGSWLYAGYVGQTRPDGPSRRGMLVIRFSGNKVSSLSLADAATATALRQAPRRPEANHLLAVR